MKRFLFGAVTVLLCVIGGSVLPVAAATNNFTITDYTVDYTLGRDDTNRSTLTTKETITADFPQANENHGLERALPLSYDKHGTSLKITSVTDASGARLEYSTSDQNDNRIVRIGNADAYVHGSKTYVITYTQRDVTRFYGDTGRDEFYWNVVGTQWSVPIQRLHATITLDGGLSVPSDGACYRGAQGESNACDIEKGATSVSVTAEQLARNEGVTVALGFEDGTFAPYEQSPAERIIAYIGMLWIIGIVVLSPIAIIVFVVALRRWYAVRDRKRELGTIVPEYLPPQGYSVIASSQVVYSAGKVFAAQLIDLAVRHYVKIYQVGKVSKFLPNQYEIELVKDMGDLTEPEQVLLKRLFPTGVIGGRFEMKRMQKEPSLNTLVRSAVTSGVPGLHHADPEQSRWFSRLGGWMLAIGLVTFSPVLVPISIVLLILGRYLRPLTVEGLTLRRYLLGLKQYISVAEVDRLRMLQSPEGANKVGVAVNGNDQAQLVKLYERVLPYAVLFNLEKGWNTQLGRYYESAAQQPDWFQGVNTFDAAVFGAAMASFSNSAASSYSTSTSSSSGGSSGGGFSGGGGGGGGGGGW